MKLLKAFDAAFTAFVDTLSPYGFPLLGDPADALEDECGGGCCRHESDVPVELAGSLDAPGDGPEVVVPPEAASTSGHPLTKDDVRQIIREEFDWLRQIAGEAYEEIRQAFNQTK